MSAFAAVCLISCSCLFASCEESFNGDPKHDGKLMYEKTMDCIGNESEMDEIMNGYALMYGTETFMATMDECSRILNEKGREIEKTW